LPGEQAYALTAIQAATAALMGLRARRLTGKGQRISVSALQSAALANYREAVMYEHTGRIGRRQGNMLVRGTSGVRQIWPCADGYVTWSMIDNPGMMRALVRVMEAEGAAGELADIDWDRILVADTEQAVIERWQRVVEAFFAVHDRETLARWSLEHGWGLSPIVRLSEVPASPQMRARGVFEDGLPGPLFAVHSGGSA
jgi:crotonobetainyl-CoA:carnitine CoA-transferase CaiB-like acyl-CoA transferase